MKEWKNLNAAVLLALIVNLPPDSLSMIEKGKRLIAQPSPFGSRGDIGNVQIPKSRVQSAEESDVLHASSTIIFEESFESASGFPPAGWISVNSDGGGTTGPWFAGNATVFTAMSGNSYAAANYQGANEFYIDEWLISPAISSVTQFDTLMFWHRSPDGSPWYDSIEVRISTSGTEPGSFTIPVDYFKTSTSGWIQNRYLLSDYVGAGSTIYIAFRYLIYDGGVSGLNSDYVGIDLVQIVRPQVDIDIQVLSINYPEDGSKVIVDQPMEPQVTFKNAGTTAQSSIPVRLRIVPPTGSIYEDNQIIASLLPGQTTNVVFEDYTPLVTGVQTVSGFSYLTGDQNTTNDSLTGIIRGAVVLSGLYTVGAGGNFTSLKSAVDTLNHNIISDHITLSLTDLIYTEPPLSLGPLDYIASEKRILLKPAAGISPIIEIEATPLEPFGFAVKGASYVTMNGSNSIQQSRNTTILVDGVYANTGILITGTDRSFADSNIIMNLNIRNGADSSVRSEGYYGILLIGYNTALKDYGNIVSNCDVTNHGAVGIASQWQEGIIIENNFVHDWDQISGDNDVHGIIVADGTLDGIIRNNIVGNIKTADNYAWAVGIENSAGEGSNISVYNNFIYNIMSYGAGTNTNRSIGLFGSSHYNSGDRYCHNSIYLSGTDLSTSELSRTAGIELAGGSDISLLNNIIYNETILSASAEENRAYCIYLSTLPDSFTSDHNIFYITSIHGVVGYNDGVRQILSEWRSSFIPYQDSASISGDPEYISKSTGNLHINSAAGSPANAAGMPVAGISRDIDGNPRNAYTPDIGADEFVPGGKMIESIYQSGWNLVSVPLTVENYQRSTLFPDAVSDAFGYSGSYGGVEIMENGIGYWLKFNAPVRTDFIGMPRSSDTVSVLRGWNIIGSITDSVSVSSIIEVPDGIIMSGYYMYDESYVVADFLVPGRGYWIKVNQDGVLILR